MADEDAVARRRKADRERKRLARAREREARALAAANRARACETSASEASAPLRLADTDDVRAALEYALQLVGADVTGSPTRRAQVVGQLAKSAADAIVQRELANRLEALELVLTERARA